MTKNKNNPLVLIILDGWGFRKENKDNGINLAKKPFFDSLIKKYPHTLIDGSGPAVGLPNGIMGNSEVGHMNIGAGRIVYTGLSQIYQAIEDGSFFKNPALMRAVDQVKKNKGTLHLMGLLSDGAVHSHQDHLYALLRMAKKNHLENVAIHCFMDGRDTPPNDGLKYINQLKEKIKEIGIGSIASIEGRFFAMDRDSRWDRNQKAFQAICGNSTNKIKDALAYLQESYENNTGDEFIEPASVIQESGNTILIGPQDAMIFFNYRADRARQITRAFFEKEFTEFDRKGQALPSVFVCAAPYDKNFGLPVAFEPVYPENTLGEAVAKSGIQQLRIAETEKYAHVTFFFNGGRDIAFKSEDRKLIPSPREVETYDQKPEMSAYQVKDEFLSLLASGKHGFIVLNFANADMVGHTAIPSAIIKAIESVDACLSEVVSKILEKGGSAIIFADHGNAEEMKDANNEPMTAHTTNLVPLILASDNFVNASLKTKGQLCDIAPTALYLMGIDKPKEMTGINLVEI